MLEVFLLGGGAGPNRRLRSVQTSPCPGELRGVQGRGRIWWRVGRQPSQYERRLAVCSSVICVARGRGGTEGVPMDGGMLIVPEQRGRCTVPICVWRRAVIVNGGACPLSFGGACLISSIPASTPFLVHDKPNNGNDSDQCNSTSNNASDDGWGVGTI